MFVALLIFMVGGPPHTIVRELPIEDYKACQMGMAAQLLGQAWIEDGHPGYTVDHWSCVLVKRREHAA